MRTDAFGNEINIGDTVVYAIDGGYFDKGKIVRFTKELVVIDMGVSSNDIPWSIKRCDYKVVKYAGK